MANLTETSSFDAGIYQFETTDLIAGGADGVDNLPHKQLANRTQYLKAHLDALELTGNYVGLGNVTGPVVLNLAQGAFFSATVTGNTQFSFSNAAAAGTAVAVVVELTNAGAFAITWPAAAKWSGGVAPILTPSGVDVLLFVTRDGGVTWRGSVYSRDNR